MNASRPRAAAGPVDGAGGAGPEAGGMESRTGTPARDATFEAVYQKLHGLARRERRRLGAQATLNTTALVHEVYLDLCKRDDPQAIRDFYAYAARAMRNLLIDAARQRLAGKRGGQLQQTGLDALDDAGIGRDAEHALELDAALRELAEADSRCAEVVGLHYFAGLPLERIAELLGVSLRTINRDWQFARAWLREQLTP